MAGAGAGLSDLAVGEHAHGGAACADGAACVTRTGPFTLPSPGGQAAAGELQRWPGYLGLKSGRYCQGRPGGADQCLNAKGNRKKATYGYDEKKKFFCKPCAGEVCAGHKPMEDVYSKKCAVSGCKKQPWYGVNEDDPATHCAEHGVKNGLKNVKFTKCATVGCQKIPTYGADPEKPATHCAKHGEPSGMKDVKSKTCAIEGCPTQPYYGADPDKPATHCAKHGKSLGMSDVKNKKCAIEGCQKQPCYGADPDEPATHCAEHGKESSLDDVKHPMCATGECTKQPTYGTDPNKPATHCAGHGKDLGMKDVHNKKCAVKGCLKIPIYGSDLEKPATHCAKHGKDLGFKDVHNPECSVDGCTKQTRSPWAPYCAACYAELHPDDPLVVARNKTETKIKMFLNDSLDAGISSLSTFNAMNVRGNRAPVWMRRYEFDFVIFGELGIIHCDGGQHKRDVARFETTAADQIENDVNKSVLVLDRGLFEVRLDQEDVWRDRCDWRSLLAGMMAFGVTHKLAGEATCVAGRRDEADLSYGPYVDAMLQTPHAGRVYEAFLTPNERDMLTVIHRASGARTHWRIPSDFKLARWPDGDAAPAAPTVPTQLTLEGAFKRRKLA